MQQSYFKTPSTEYIGVIHDPCAHDALKTIFFVCEIIQNDSVYISVTVFFFIALGIRKKTSFLPFIITAA